MNNIDIEKLIKNCDILQKYTVPFKDGCMHSSVRCFDACMRTFDREVLPAEAITFKIYLAAPVNAYGKATFYRDGKMEIRRI